MSCSDGSWRACLVHVECGIYGPTHLKWKGHYVPPRLCSLAFVPRLCRVPCPRVHFISPCICPFLSFFLVIFVSLIDVPL